VSGCAPRDDRIGELLHLLNLSARAIERDDQVG